ncbi:MAG: hypothetical protein EGP94_10800 [Lachnospiraceae bacterium]|nr:hypothetical protein [Lachnospiraceae bacterium]
MIIRWSNQLQAACRRNEAASVDQEPAASFIDQRQLVKIMKMKLLIEAALRFRIAIIFCYFKFSIVFFTNSSYDKFRQRQYNFAREKQIHLFQDTRKEFIQWHS